MSAVALFRRLALVTALFAYLQIALGGAFFDDLKRLHESGQTASGSKTKATRPDSRFAINQTHLFNQTVFSSSSWSPVGTKPCTYF